MSRIRTNKISDSDCNHTLLDSEKELVGVVGSLAVVQVKPDWYNLQDRDDKLRARILAQDLFGPNKVVSYLTAEDLDSLIDMLIGVRTDIQKTVY